MASQSLQQSMRFLETINPNVLVIGDEIGKGRFKRVHRGKYKRKDVVVLKYSKDNDVEEMKIVAMLARNGPNDFVPEIYGMCSDRQTLSIVEELAAFGTVKAAIQRTDLGWEGNFTVAHKLYSAMKLALAMEYLQQQRVVHNDISCRNVLINRLEADPSTINVKMTDFGLSVVVPEGSDHVIRRQPQAVRWCPPETIAKMVLSHRADVWALAMTYWEMFANGTAPWARHEKRADVAQRLKDMAGMLGTAEAVVAEKEMALDVYKIGGMSDQMQAVILRCLKIDEHARPSFREISELWRRVVEVAPDQESEKNEEAAAALVANTVVAPTPSTASPFSGDDLATRTCVTSEARPLWCYNEDSSDDDAYSDHDANRHFKAMKKFLRSSHAEQVISEDSLQGLWHEIDEAKAREAYLLDLVRRMQAAQVQATPTQGGQDSPKAGRSLQLPPATRVAAPEGCGSLGGYSGFRSVPMGGARSPFGCPVGYMTPRPVAPSATGVWSLHSFAGSALKRQDFAREREALVAFDGAAKVGPCMLRDPAGREAAAHNWVSTYFNTQSPAQASPRYVESTYRWPSPRQGSMSPVRWSPPPYTGGFRIAPPTV